VLRLAAGHRGEPTAAIIDSRTLRSTPESGECAGYDGGKRKKGSKIHMAVDTLVICWCFMSHRQRPRRGQNSSRVPCRPSSMTPSNLSGRPGLYRRAGREGRSQTSLGLRSSDYLKPSALRPLAATLGCQTVICMGDPLPTPCASPATHLRRKVALIIFFAVM
jgi:hypothetical protein